MLQARAARLLRLLQCWRSQAADAAKLSRAVQGAATAHERMLLNRCVDSGRKPVLICAAHCIIIKCLAAVLALPVGLLLAVTLCLLLLWYACCDVMQL
jgi:hypothetical protein